MECAHIVGDELYLCRFFGESVLKRFHKSDVSGCIPKGDIWPKKTFSDEFKLGSEMAVVQMRDEKLNHIRA